MYGIKNILVPIDFSDKSYLGLKAAGRLAQQFQSKISLVHFYQPTTRTKSTAGTGSIKQSLNKNNYNTELEILSKKLQAVMYENVPEDFRNVTHVIRGTIADTFESFSQEINADLVISGTSGTHDIMEYFVGNNTENMIRHSSIPVVAVSEEEDIILQDILIAIDLNLPIPDRIYELAKFLEIHGSIIHFAHISETGLKDQQSIKSSIEFLAQKFNIKNFETHIVEPQAPVKGILEIAKKVKAGLILMKVYEKTSVGAFIGGSYTEEVIREGDIPVMVDKVKVSDSK